MLLYVVICFTCYMLLLYFVMLLYVVCCYMLYFVICCYVICCLICGGRNLILYFILYLYAKKNPPVLCTLVKDCYDCCIIFIFIVVFNCTYWGGQIIGAHIHHFYDYWYLLFF